MSLPLTWPSATLSPSDGERIARKPSRLEPVNLADEGPKDLSRTKNEFPIFVFPKSLGRFMGRDGVRGALSIAARQRLLSRRGEPLFIADWDRVLMIHFEVNAKALQRDVPFQLDLRDGRAFVSLVAFTMRNLRPRFGSRLAVWLFRPLATHHFLNVRTYVRHGGESGIHFLCEWLSSWLAVRFGPATFGLPYRHGRIAYRHDWPAGDLQGRVADVHAATALAYRGKMAAPISFAPCECGSLDEWLMERYTAFTCWRNKKRFFRIWHAPWPQCPVAVDLRDNSLASENWSWFADARLIGANFSPGVRKVWMGCPHAADSIRR